MENDPKPTKGRTTRMLAEAERLAAEGNSVMVIMQTFEECDALLPRFAGNPEIWLFALEMAIDVDFQTLTAQSFPSAIVLFDHAAMEEYIAKHLEMLHRFD